MLLSGCVTAEGQATRAPLSPAIPAEKSQEQLGSNNQDDVAAEPSVPDTAPAAEIADSDPTIPQDDSTEAADAGTGDSLADDEMTALPAEDETLIAAVIPPPAPEPQPAPEPEPEPAPELPLGLTLKAL